jgi:hypothetical protein
MGCVRSTPSLASTKRFGTPVGLKGTGSHVMNVAIGMDRMGKKWTTETQSTTDDATTRHRRLSQHFAVPITRYRRAQATMTRTRRTVIHITGRGVH